MIANLKTPVKYAAAVVLCLILLSVTMQLWRADFHIPFTYFGDALLNSAATKGAIEHGWWWHNPALGAPATLNYVAYPAIDNAHFLIIKAISLVTGNHASTLNLFFLLTFPLTTVTSLFCLRQLKLNYPVALCGSLLFTFLPYHFFRSYHLFLAAYYPLPLIILIVLWVCGGTAILFGPSRSRFWPKIQWRNRKAIFSLLVCVFIGACGIYYPFFAAFFLLVAGVVASLERKVFYPLWTAMALIGVISVVLLLNLLPSFNYRLKHGPASLGARSVADAEIMGLKITQLVLPIGGHRVPALGALKYRYNLGPLVNENDTASLGLIGTVGFLVLIFRLFHRKPKDAVFDHLSMLNLAGLLLGTIGGIGVLFALFVSTQIRAYNRVSIFIAFFALIAVALMLDRFSAGLRRRTARVGFLLILGIITILGILDQTTTTFFFVPEYEKIKAEYRGDSEFVGKIESAMPAGAMIFQLPYVPFPESPPIQKMSQDHEHFKGYLHSTKLRWSYGVVIGEKEDVWQRDVVTKPVPEFVRDLTSRGFMGIYINRNGYEDRAASLEVQLTSLLGTGPINSPDGNLLFFSLASLNQSNLAIDE